MERSLTAQSILQEDTYKQFRKAIQKEQDNEFRLKLAVALILFWCFWLVRCPRLRDRARHSGLTMSS